MNVSLDGYEPQSQKVKVVSGAKTTAVFELQKEGPDEQAPLAPAADAETESTDQGDEMPAEPEQDKKRMLKGLFVGGLAGTVAAGTLAGVFWGLTASSKSDYMDYKDDVEDPSTGPLADELEKLNQAKDDTEKRNRLAVGFTIGAGALAAATTVLFFMSRSDEQPEAESGPEVSVFPGGVEIRF